MTERSNPAPVGEPTPAQESVRDRILAERDKGNIVFMGLEHALMSAPIADFVKQPADGILYDLNRGEEVSMTFINDPKWVNDYAVALVIRKLIEQRDNLQRERAAFVDALHQAKEALDRHWFSDGGDGESYNNDDVIEASAKIDEVLK